VYQKEMRMQVKWVEVESPGSCSQEEISTERQRAAFQISGIGSLLMGGRRGSGGRNDFEKVLPKKADLVFKNHGVEKQR